MFLGCLVMSFLFGTAQLDGPNHQDEETAKLQVERSPSGLSEDGTQITCDQYAYENPEILESLLKGYPSCLNRRDVCELLLQAVNAFGKRTENEDAESAYWILQDKLQTDFSTQDIELKNSINQQSPLEMLSKQAVSLRNQGKHAEANAVFEKYEEICNLLTQKVTRLVMVINGSKIL